MIIFDYGQTLVDEEPFNGIKGTKAVLCEAANNPNNITAEEIQEMANELNREIGRYGTNFEKQSLFEVHNHVFQKYLYEYFGIELTKSPEEVERIFEESASAAEPTKNINDFLCFLDNKKIRAGVISNISFSGKMLSERINRYMPYHKFEFIIASSEYVFRKPHKRIFEIALRKANLKPHEVWYCGDNPVFDVDGAAKCGIYPIWYKGALEEGNKYIPKCDYLEIFQWNDLMKVINEKEQN